MMFAEAIEPLRRYFAEQNIDTYGFTLILNFQDFQSAAKLEHAIRKELLALTQYQAEDPLEDGVSFKLKGIAVSIESPIHVRLLG